MDRHEMHKKIATIVEDMESRYPENDIATAIMFHVVIPALKEDGHLDALAQVSWAFEQLEQAETIWQQAAAYTRLANAMADLETWHPDFDIETGEIRETDDEVLSDPDMHYDPIVKTITDKLYGE